MAEFAWDNPHAHHWLLSPAGQGKTSEGKCACGAVREFSNIYEKDADDYNRKPWSAPITPKQTVTVYPTRGDERRKKAARR